MSGLRAVLRVADAGSGVGWTRLCDYTEPVAGELARREPAVAGIPLILSWSGTLTVNGSRFDAGFVAGPADRYADTLTTGHAHGVQVDLTWLGGRRLLGLPLQELAYRNLAVEKVWGREGRLLLDRLAGTRSAGARLDLVEAFVRTRALCPDTVPPVVAGAVALLNRHRGRLGAAELAQRLGYGRQYVHQQVSRHLGLPPRTLARLLRFQAVAAAVRAGRVARVGWAGLAAAGGYADQSHLHREFRALAGMTPAQALREWTAGRHSFNPATDADR
jgi:AraC-like DNA-binding protein